MYEAAVMRSEKVVTLVFEQKIKFPVYKKIIPTPHYDVLLMYRRAIGQDISKPKTSVCLLIEEPACEGYLDNTSLYNVVH